VWGGLWGGGWGGGYVVCFDVSFFTKINGGWWLVVGWLVGGRWWLVVGGWWLVGGGWWLVVGGWWLVVGGWWLVAGGWWLVVGGWWLVVGTSIRGPKMEVLAAIIALSTDCEGFISSCKMVTIGDCMGLYHCIKLFK